jgi:hypothetical protein
MPKKQRDPDEDARLIGGIALITLGVIFIMNIAFGWDVMWPLFITFAGVMVVTAHLINPQDTEGTIIGSGVLFTLSIFFLLFTTGVLQWGNMAWLWPGFLLAPGIGLLAAYFYTKDKEQLIPALVLITIFIVFSFGSLYNLWTYWPIILIVIGALIIIIDRIK